VHIPRISGAQRCSVVKGTTRYHPRRGGDARRQEEDGFFSAKRNLYPSGLKDETPAIGTIPRSPGDYSASRSSHYSSTC